MFVSSQKRVDLVVQTARSGGTHEISIFIAHSPGKWAYKGSYRVAFEGKTPPGAMVDLPAAGQNIIDGVLAGHLEQAEKTLRKQQHPEVGKKPPALWGPQVEGDWGIELGGSAMDQLKTREEAGLRLVVFTFSRIDEESVAQWSRR